MNDTPRWWWSGKRRRAWQAERHAERVAAWESGRDRRIREVDAANARFLAATVASPPVPPRRVSSPGTRSRTADAPDSVPVFVPAASDTPRCAGGSDAPHSSGWGSSDTGGSCSSGGDGGGGGGGGE